MSIFKPTSKKMTHKGFGFLGMVMMIIGFSMAATMVLLSVESSVTNEQLKITDEVANDLRDAINDYKANRDGTPPPALTDLVTDDSVACAPDNNPVNSTYLTLQGWCGPYIDQPFQNDSDSYRRDGWGTLFEWDNGTEILTSCGPDRTCTTGDDLTFNP